MIKLSGISQWVLRAGLVIYALSAVTSISGISAGVVLALLGGLVFFALDLYGEKQTYGEIISLSAEKKRVLVLLAGFILVCIASPLFSYSPRSTVRRLFNLLGEISLFPLVFIILKDRDRAFTKKLLDVLLVMAVIQAVYGIIQYFTGLNVTSSPDVERFGRIKGTLGHWNAVGGVIAMLTPLAAVRIFNGKGRERIFFIVGTAAMLAAVFFTFTRGAWMGIAAAFMVMGIIKGKRFFILMFVFLALVFLLPLTRARIAQTIRNPDPLRILFWQSTLDMISKRPLTGWGLDSFQKLFYERYAKQDDGLAHFHCHNTYLGITQETGLPGLVLFLVMNILFFRRIIKKVKTGDGFEASLALALAGSFTAFLVHGLVDFSFRGETAYLFWFLAGILFR
ncbi:MAG: O-antigen ligase family protein [Elusimicrobia bacterium]|nr:O-antigen ligase family protein [Elusimicrobiota bacterium]